MCYYTDTVRGKDEVWNETEFEVRVDRTESIDETSAEIENFRTSENWTEMHDVWSRHWQHMIREKIDPNERANRTNRKVQPIISIWIHTGPDHFAHAQNYLRIAYRS